MKLIGLMVARNEGWVIGASARAAMAWLDELIVWNHASTDNTKKVVDAVDAEFPDRVHKVDISNPDWNEADYRQGLLVEGRKRGGTHFAIIDADEILTANLVPTIRKTVEELNPGQAAALSWVHLWRSLDHYRSDNSDFGRATTTVFFCDAPHLAHRATDGYQLHKRAPTGVQLTHPIRRRDGGLLHLQHANWERVLWKQRLYELDEMLRYGKVHANYWRALDEKGLETTPVPAEWWPEGRERIDLKVEPWQRSEVLRLLKKHGREKFKGAKLITDDVR